MIFSYYLFIMSMVSSLMQLVMEHSIHYHRNLVSKHRNIHQFNSRYDYQTSNVYTLTLCNEVLFMLRNSIYVALIYCAMHILIYFFFFFEDLPMTTSQFQIFNRCKIQYIFISMTNIAKIYSKMKETDNLKYTIVWSNGGWVL